MAADESLTFHRYGVYRETRSVGNFPPDSLKRVNYLELSIQFLHRPPQPTHSAFDAIGNWR